MRKETKKSKERKHLGLLVFFRFLFDVPYLLCNLLQRVLVVGVLKLKI